MKQRFKRTVSLLLAVFLLCGVFAAAPVTVHAAAAEYTTATGGVYSFDSETGELHLISGEFTGKAWQTTGAVSDAPVWTTTDFNGADVKFITANEGVKFTGDCTGMFKQSFSNCESIDLSNVDTSNVTNMRAMFRQCTGLVSLDISGFNTSNVTNMYGMFFGDSKLTALDFSSFDMSKVTDVGYMFNACSTLRSLTLSEKFTGGITSSMRLNNGKSTTDWGWITSDSTDGTIISGTGEFAVIGAPSQTVTYIWFADSANYTFDPATGELHLISGFFRGTTWQTTDYGSATPAWTANDFNGADVKSITADAGVKFTGDCTGMFKRNFSNCESIDLSNVDTSNVTNMQAMFRQCTGLVSLDISGFNTSNVTNMYGMFFGDSKLTSLDLSSFDMSKVTDVGYMFNACSTLRSLTLSEKFTGGITSSMRLNNGKSTTDWGWITSDSTDGTIISGTGEFAVIGAPSQKTTYIWYTGIYEFIEETGELHLISGFFRGTSWQYGDYTNMTWTAEDFDGADVKSVTADAGVKFTGSCQNMFNYSFPNCESIDLSKVDTSNVTDMTTMFRDCPNLTFLDISNFNTSNVTSTFGMFLRDYKLTSLNLSSFDMSKVTDSSRMFDSCNTLRSLTISETFTGGIKDGMRLNNGKNSDKGWITNDSTDGTIISGGTTSDYAVIAAPSDTTAFIWYAGVYEFIEETAELRLISGFFKGTAWQYGDYTNMTWTAEDFDGADVKSVTADAGVKFTGSCQNMFNYSFPNCESIDLSKVDTSNVTDMTTMFRDCPNLTFLDISNFNTSNVTSTFGMFLRDYKLTSLNLSSFDMSKVTDNARMFDSCSTLRNLTISETFTGGITGGMNLNNGDNGDGWRVKGEPNSERISGTVGYAVIATPSDDTTYKWIGYYDVDWQNWDGKQLVKTEEYKSEAEGIHPTYKGAAPTRSESGGKTYTFAGWTDGETTYGVNDELPPVTKDVTYTAVFEEADIKLFTSHSLTLRGDIGVNYYLDVRAAGITPSDIQSGANTLTVDFSWETDPAPYCDVAPYSVVINKDNFRQYYDTTYGEYFKVTCNVAVAEMACVIKADGAVSGSADYTETDHYSVRDYGMAIINNADKYSEELVTLAKEMLNYGAKAQTVFRILPNDLANKDVDGYSMSEATAEMVEAAIAAEAKNAGKTTTDMSAGTGGFGLKYYAPSVVFLTKTTLRQYYTVTDSEVYEAAKSGLTGAALNETKLPFVCFDFADIPAAELDVLQSFTIGGQTYHYSVLDSAKKLIAGSNTAQRELGMATYWYNNAANAYFD